jgi:hypothetical protein
LEQEPSNISLGGEDKRKKTDNCNGHGINPPIEINKQLDIQEQDIRIAYAATATFHQQHRFYHTTIYFFT